MRLSIKKTPAKLWENPGKPRKTRRGGAEGLGGQPIRGRDLIM